MRLAAWSAAGLALIALAAASPADAREQSRKCYPRGYSGIAASTRVRVFYGENVDGDYRYYACDLLTGRRTRIAEGTFRDSDTLRDFRFAGRVLAFQHADCDFTLNPTPCPAAVETLDVQTRGARSGTVGGTVTDLVVQRNGAAAWIESRQGTVPTRAVMRLGADGKTSELAAGPTVESGSLALAQDGTVYWREAELPRSAPLDPTAGPPFQRDPEPKGRRACFPKGSLTDAASTRVRVYNVDDGEGEDLYSACDLRTGRRVQFATHFTDNENFQIGVFRFAGSFAAFEVCNSYRGTACTGQLRLFDADGKRTWPSTQALVVANRITDIALEPNGSVAWINAVEDGYRSPASKDAVFRCELGGCGKVEEGTGIGTRSLALSAGSHLYWTRDGTPRTATLD